MEIYIEPNIILSMVERLKSNISTLKRNKPGKCSCGEDYDDYVEHLNSSRHLKGKAMTM